MTVRPGAVPAAVKVLADHPQLRGVHALTDALDQAARWSA